jgi:hypothetical protein
MYILLIACNLIFTCIVLSSWIYLAPPFLCLKILALISSTPKKLKAVNQSFCLLQIFFSTWFFKVPKASTTNFIGTYKTVLPLGHNHSLLSEILLYAGWPVSYTATVCRMECHRLWGRLETV